MPVTTLAPSGLSLPHPASRQLEERGVGVDQNRCAPEPNLPRSVPLDSLVASPGRAFEQLLELLGFASIAAQLARYRRTGVDLGAEGLHGGDVGDGLRVRPMLRTSSAASAARRHRDRRRLAHHRPDRIDAFADATGVTSGSTSTPKAAAGRSGSTIAHGFLTLSLTVALTQGIELVWRARWRSARPGQGAVHRSRAGREPVRRAELMDVAEKGGGIQVKRKVTIEREGGAPGDGETLPLLLSRLPPGQARPALRRSR